MRYVVTLEEEDGWVIAECPSLPGCVSQGRTREEAITNIRDAIQLSLETRTANGIPIPESIEVEVSAARAA
jgi:predicted RNase H-like HicB family nuclease